MKSIILCGINAKFSHSSLSLLCLKHAAKRDVDTLEFSINDSVPSIVRAIALKTPAAAGFSCYIWNIEHVLKVASSLKKILPGCLILLGGPEVSFGGEDLMRQNPFIDIIIRGAGELPFSHFAGLLETGYIYGTPSANIRKGDEIITTSDAPPYDMNNTPFMYGDLSEFRNKIVYYETSRGCPFRCAYCMSANEDVSFLPAERVKAELEYFMQSGIKQVKFVDRTFNFPAGRAYEIIEALIGLSEAYPDSKTNFHLEITASLLDDDMLSLLRKAKKGLLRLEVGIQSTNPDTLNAVNRRLDTRALLKNARELCSMGNLRVHADLIAGLPLETYQSFKTSFNDVYGLGPHELQLGFLKVLKGSPIRDMTGKYGIVYTSYAPYEVLSTNDISFAELSWLHYVEQALNLLYNSRLCVNALERLTASFESAFDFFESFALHLESAGWFSRSHKTKEVFETLHAFAVSRRIISDELTEALLLDWLYFGKPGDYPSFLKSAADGDTEQLRSFLAGAENIQKYIPEYSGLSSRESTRRLHIHTFSTIFPGKTTLLFDYGKRRDEEGFCQTVV